jgi:hypothetical protein
MGSNKKEAQKHQAEHQASESAEANFCGQQLLIEDRRLVELLELQERMFQST